MSGTVAARSRIVTDHEALRAPSEPVGPEDDARALSRRLLAVMAARPGTLGVAAPQIGVRKRMFVYNFAGMPRKGLPGEVPKSGVVINPSVLSISKVFVTNTERCLSFPGKSVRVTRPTVAMIRWESIDGTVHTTELSGHACRVWLHEIDHLDGVLMTDRAAT